MTLILWSFEKPSFVSNSKYVIWKSFWNINLKHSQNRVKHTAEQIVNATINNTSFCFYPAHLLLYFIDRTLVAIEDILRENVKSSQPISSEEIFFAEQKNKPSNFLNSFPLPGASESFNPRLLRFPSISFLVFSSILNLLFFFYTYLFSFSLSFSLFLPFFKNLFRNDSRSTESLKRPFIRSNSPDALFYKFITSRARYLFLSLPGNVSGR